MKITELLLVRHFVLTVLLIIFRIVFKTQVFRRNRTTKINFEHYV